MLCSCLLVSCFTKDVGITWYLVAIQLTQQCLLLFKQYITYFGQDVGHFGNAMAVPAVNYF